MWSTNDLVDLVRQNPLTRTLGTHARAATYGASVRTSEAVQVGYWCTLGNLDGRAEERPSGRSSLVCRHSSRLAPRMTPMVRTHQRPCGHHHREFALPASDGVDTDVKPSGDGCVECLASAGWWFHLRRCAECGHIGCCDSSPQQHAQSHSKQSGHPLIQSFEPGEDWFWDYPSADYYDGPELAAPTSHPTDQPTPGGKVPADWQQHLN